MQLRLALLGPKPTAVCVMATFQENTGAAQGREARIVARRQRIEARIGARADGEGAPSSPFGSRVTHSFTKK